MNSIIHAEEVSPQWLTDVLREDGCLTIGTVTSLDITSDTTLLSDLIRMRVQYSETAGDRVPARLLLKSSRLDPELTLSVGRREVDFYQKIAPQMTHAPVPRCYSALYFEETDRYQLLLEDLSETHSSRPLSDIPATETECDQIVRAVARYQAFWWDHPELGKSVGTKPSAASIKGFCDWAGRMYPKFADHLGDRLSPEKRALYNETLTGLEGALTKRLLDRPNLTLYHGDSHIGNYLFPRDGDTACIIDWQGWGVELGVLDLVSLMALFWPPERRARQEKPLLQHYYRLLRQEGVPASYTWDDCWQDYRLEILKAMFFVVSHWKMGLAEDIWWDHLEWICAAADDLNCLELLR